MKAKQPTNSTAIITIQKQNFITQVELVDHLTQLAADYSNKEVLPQGN